MKCGNMILTRRKTSKKFQNEFERLSKRSQKELMEQMTALKRFCSECMKANISTQPLIKLLSTIYGQTMVTRGYLAILKDKNSSMPIHLSRDIWSDYLNWLMEENHLTDWILMNAQDGLETRSTAPPLGSFTGGD